MVGDQVVGDSQTTSKGLKSCHIPTATTFQPPTPTRLYPDSQPQPQQCPDPVPVCRTPNRQNRKAGGLLHSRLGILESSPPPRPPQDLRIKGVYAARIQRRPRNLASPTREEIQREMLLEQAGWLDLGSDALVDTDR